MKKQLLSIFVLALLTLVACKETATDAKTDMADNTDAVEQAEAPNYAEFDKKIEVIRSFIKAHCDENLEAQTDLLADTLKWSPANYNDNKWLGKADFVAALKGYHDGYENIRYTEGITLPDTTAAGFFAGHVFPENQPASSPNLFRTYGTWSATHTESGKAIGVKYYTIINVNEANQIAVYTEYWDVNGLAAQIADD